MSSGFSVGMKDIIAVVSSVVFEVNGAPILKLSLRLRVIANSSMRWRNLAPINFKGM